MVTSELLIFSVDFREIFPETFKRIIRAPLVSTAALKLPVPESFKLVTNKTFPPLPPVVFCPKPCAPGKA
ncbi:hypothetical protein D3C85_1767380 [compost metagenome]